MDWKTRFFVFLASPVISSALVLALMVSFYLEISHPGFGLPGVVALVSLFLIILSSLSLEIASWLEVILLVTGLAIIVVDLFVLPTFGLLGIVGILFFIAGLFGMLLPGLSSVNFTFNPESWNAAGNAVLERLAWLCGTLLLGFVIIFFLGRYVTPRVASWSRLVLKGSEQEGYISGVNPSELPAIGSQGIAFSTLRPAGKIQIGEMIYDAMTGGDFIEQGTPIVVAHHDGSTIIVRKDAGIV
jgi:membrane-bound serine protease (ClpP class)